MLPIRLAFAVLSTLYMVEWARAQVGLTLTGRNGVCASEAQQSANLARQEVVLLRAQSDQAEQLLDDIASMEKCAARQMVWVAGDPRHDPDGCISVEAFRGDPGDSGPQGQQGKDATCP